MGANVMWRSVPPEVLHMHDEQIYPPQPHSLPIPNEVLREASSVSDLAAFFAIGEAWAQMVAHYLPRDARIVDIGCGCGKLARFFYIVPGVTYVGIDLYLPSIKWCQKVFAPYADRFQFVHFDGHSDVYNPTGTIKASEYVLPLNDEEVDMTVCASLFTHLYEADARHYLEEIRRTTKPGGQAIISIHDKPKSGGFEGDEVRIDISHDYFAKMCAEAGMPVVEEIGFIYGQTAFLLRRPD
jgi:SAM-dependent methyltransferase